MTSVTYPGGTDTFTYNALGQRLRATLNGATKRYVYTGERVLEETDDSGNMLVRYTLADSSYFSPMVQFKRADGTVRYPAHDAVGSVLRLLDGSHATTDTYDLDAFGRQLASTGTTPNPYRFGGEWGYITDPSGLLQLGARFYWPELGRFVQQDPIGDGMNWYAYAGGNPVTRIDPSGLRLRDTLKKPFVALGAVIGDLFWPDRSEHSISPAATQPQPVSGMNDVCETALAAGAIGATSAGVVSASVQEATSKAGTTASARWILAGRVAAVVGVVAAAVGGVIYYTQGKDQVITGAGIPVNDFYKSGGYQGRADGKTLDDDLRETGSGSLEDFTPPGLKRMQDQ